MYKLDYSIKTPQQRTEYVNKLIQEYGYESLSYIQLQKLSNYILSAIHDKQILTDNRLITIKKRQTSFEGFCQQDYVYNYVSDLGKNTILQPKDPITKHDLDTMPALNSLHEEIAAMDKDRLDYRRRKQLIQMRQQQYIIRNQLRGGPQYTHSTGQNSLNIHLYDDITFDECGNPVNNGPVSLFNYKHISALLCHYEEIKIAVGKDVESDLNYLMQDLDNLIARSLSPFYLEILKLKIQKKTNAEIQQKLLGKFGYTHTPQYLSSLWRNKIPKLIAEQAQCQYIEWYYTQKERGNWKKCKRCQQIKLAHPKFFSKNKSGKDGFYSICKECRRRKTNSELKKRIYMRQGG